MLTRMTRQHNEMPPAMSLAIFVSLALAAVIGTSQGTAYAAAGDLDPTFDTDGWVTTDYIGTYDEARAVAIQPDGKIVVAGTTLISGSNWNFALARYNPNGSPDTTFSGDGKLTTDFLGHGLDDGAYAVAIQPDGKIVAAGATNTFSGDTNYDFGVARYNPDGSLDTSFAGSGMAIIGFADIAEPEVSIANAVVIQPDGKIVAAGYTDQEGVVNFALARLFSNGNLDANFDGNGLLTTDFSGCRDEARAVLLQPDGKIVAGGLAASGTNCSNSNFAVARYNTNGSLDTSFDVDGKVTRDLFGGDDSIKSIALQPDGKIVTAGYSFVNSQVGYNVAFARLHPSGALDQAFGSNGVQTVDVGGSDAAQAVVIQPDGKIVGGGYGRVGPFNDFALVRMHTNGTFDASFGGDGIVTNEFEGGPDQINGLALQADGKLVATGVVYRLFPDSYDIGVARYQAGGAATPTPTRTATRTPTNTPTTAPTQTPGGPTATPVPSVTACPIQFPDVSPGSTFHDFVRCLACRGIVNGLSDGTFGPNNPVTRGQLSKIVSNAAGFSENIGNNSFEDVPVGSTFHQFVERLFLRGIINGFNCGGPGEPCVPPQNKPYFRPNANVTRAQTSKIVASAAGFPAPPSGQQSFEDAQEGSTFWQWIEALAGRAIINGFACGNPEPCVPPGNRPYFRPNNQVTRGQSAKIVANTFFPECVTPQRAK